MFTKYTKLVHIIYYMFTYVYTTHILYISLPLNINYTSGCMYVYLQVFTWYN